MRSNMMTLFVFALFELLFRFAVSGHADNLLAVAGYTLLYFIIYQTAFRISLSLLTACFLGLPVLLFAAGWLVWPCAALLSCATLMSCYWIRQSLPLPEAGAPPTSYSTLVSFLMITGWVHLSGAGGHGFQSIDYVAHNARLWELVTFPWPVRYENGQALTFYVAYYLPSAALGKFMGFEVAYLSMYFWTLLGITLVWRWLIHLTQNCSPLLAAVGLVFFSGWDFIGYVWHTWPEWPSPQQLMRVHFFWIDLWPGERIQFNVGAYLSNTFQLYWAPHQIMAGWLVAALLLHSFLQRQWRVMGAIYALLLLWAPMIMLGLLPLLFLLYLGAGRDHWASAWSWQNVLAGAVPLFLFASYYLSGNALTNPSGWLWQVLDIRQAYPALLVMMLASWGLYASLLVPAWRMGFGPGYQYAFFATLLALLFIPFYWYGEWADLMSRASAPLMFLLLVFMLSGITTALSGRRHAYAAALLVALMLGGLSASRLLLQSWQAYEPPPPVFFRSIDSPTASEYVGSQNSFFFRYLAKTGTEP